MAIKSSSVARIVDRFGGQNAMARALGIRQSTIFGWVRSGQIPRRHVAAVRKAALDLDPPMVLTAEDFIDLDDDTGDDQHGGVQCGEQFAPT